MDGRCAQAHVLVRVEHMRPVNDMPYAASYASAGVGEWMVMELPHLHIDESADYLAIDRLNHIRIRAATLGLTSHLRDDPLHTVGVTYAFLIFLECRRLHGILAAFYQSMRWSGHRWRRCANALRPDCCTARRSPLISGDYGRYNKTCRYGLLFDTITLCNEHKQRRFDALGTVHSAHTR